MIGIVGPSASGKSAVGEFLIKKYKYNVINADSKQFYKSFKCLTAAPENLENHHLYSILDDKETINAFQWYELVEKTIKYINNEKICILGGTGMYFSILQNGISKIEYKNEEITEEELIKKLSQHKPELLEKFKDFRRRKKAWLFYKQTGKTIEESYNNERKFECKMKLYAIMPEKKVLWENILTRLNRDFEKMVEEVALNSYNHESIIGFSIIKKYLAKEINKTECIEQIFIKTRQYTKRQITYINNCLKIEKKFSSSQDLIEYLSKNNI